MSYTLTSPFPTIADIPKVSEGLYFTGTRIMWYDNTSIETRLLATVGGFTDDIWRAMYVNLATGAHNLVSGGSGAVWNGAYNPSNRRLYCGASYGKSLTEFNPLSTPPSTTVINDTDVGQYVDLRVGKDNRVYYTSFDLPSAQIEVHSYDPVVGLPTGFKHYPTRSNTANNNHGWTDADADYVYFAYQRDDGKYTLVSSPNTGTPSWTPWTYDTTSDLFVIIRRDVNGDLFAQRTRSDGTNRYYYLSGGGPGTELLTEPTRPTTSNAAPYWCVACSDETVYYQFNLYYGYDVDFSELFPIKTVHEKSKVGYKLHANPNFSYVEDDYTGPWADMTVNGMVAKSPGVMFCLTDTYNAASLLAYTTNSYPECTTYLGAEVISPYVVKKHPTSGEYYYAGYSDKMLRYDPALVIDGVPGKWTLNNSNSATHVPGDSGKPNPYVCYLNYPYNLHYRCWLDFDHNGYVWLGGNTTRWPDNHPGEPDFGNVMWYNPSDGSVDYVFDDWKTPGIQIMSLCACLSRSKILVSDHRDNLYKIDADTRLPETSTTVLNSGTSKSVILEASNDRVFVITIDAGSVYRVGLFKPSDMSWVVSPKTLGVSGQPFGYEDSKYTRPFWKLELGPDNWIWMYVGNTLYRIDPTDSNLTFNSIATTGKAAITFAYNNVDLLLYNINGGADRGDPNVKWFPGILTSSEPLINFSKGAYTILPSNDNDLSYLYTSQQLSDVAIDDSTRVSESAILQYAVHEFKQTAGISDLAMNISCDLQTDIAPSHSPVVLEVFDHNSNQWVEVTRDDSSGANTDFTLTFTVNSGSNPTFANAKNVNRVISCRVWQHAE